VVSDALERGISADRITSADIDRSAEGHFGRALGIREEAVRQALDPAENIRTRTVQGGPAPANMAGMIAGRRAALAGDRDAVRAVAMRVDQARARCFDLAQNRVMPKAS
jgi:argininosuccinate lyase